MEKLKLGIIGCGNIAEVHIEAYKAVASKATVTAVCDIDEEKAKAFAEKHGVAKYYTDFNEMLAKENLNGVSVCAWHNVHRDATVAALNAGANVFCEKPMAMNAIEAQEMLDLSTKKNKVLQLGFVRRFSNTSRLIKKYIDSGAMGDVYYAKVSYLRRNGCPGGWFGDMKYAGGGPLIDLAVHFLDEIRFVTNSPNPISAYGYSFDNLGYNRASGGQSWVASGSKFADFKYDVEDFAGGVIKFDNGMTLFIESSFNLNIKKDFGNVELFGTKAGLRKEPQLEFFADQNGVFVDTTPIKQDDSRMFYEELEHFVDCIRGEAQCICTGEDGLAVMKMIDAVYESARTGKLVEIK